MVTVSKIERQDSVLLDTAPLADSAAQHMRRSCNICISAVTADCHQIPSSIYGCICDIIGHQLAKYLEGGSRQRADSARRAISRSNDANKVILLIRDTGFSIVSLIDRSYVMLQGV
jgi:hypothetical protein